jgi:hypothetical protein
VWTHVNRIPRLLLFGAVKIFSSTVHCFTLFKEASAKDEIKKRFVRFKEILKKISRRDTDGRVHH